jgi:hypothetical protein
VEQKSIKGEIVRGGVLDGFFEDYKKEWLWRFAYRMYLNLPTVVRNGFMLFRRLVKIWRN